MTNRTIIIVAVVNGKDEPLGHIESMQTIKSSDDAVKITASRMRFAKKRMEEIFPNRKLKVDSRIYPFDICIIDDEIINTRYKNVWITSIGYTYVTDDLFITEGIEMEAEKEIPTVALHIISSGS
jgi:hypothetical protein